MKLIFVFFFVLVRHEIKKLHKSAANCWVIWSKFKTAHHSHLFLKSLVTHIFRNTYRLVYAAENGIGICFFMSSETKYLV